MPKRKRTVAELAKEAGISNDEALITLWDNEFDNIMSMNDFIYQGDLNRARRCLGLATKRELQQVNYWENLFEQTDEVFTQVISNLDIVILPNQSKLNRKDLGRLRSYATKKGIDIVKGKLIPNTFKQENYANSPFELNITGKIKELRLLTSKEVEAIHLKLVDDFKNSPDPIFPSGIKDKNLLESAVYRSQTSLGNVLKYPTIEMSAAALLHSLIHNHPFHNGNKRTALVSMLVFLDENCIYPEFNQDELFKLVLQVAQHSIVKEKDSQLPDREVAAIAEWLINKVRSLDKRHKPIQFRKLKQILTQFGCKIEHSGHGNKYNIERKVKVNRLFGIKFNETLSATLSSRNDGTEIDIPTLRRLREKLRLDDENGGIDCYQFYSAYKTDSIDFIDYYRKILRRLAKL